MSIRRRLGRLERARAELAPEDPARIRAQLVARLEGIRRRLLNTTVPPLPRSEMSLAEQLATADSAEESQAVMTTVREKLRIC